MSDNNHGTKPNSNPAAEEQHGLGMEELLEATQMNPEDRSQLESIRERVQNASKAMRAAIVE